MSLLVGVLRPRVNGALLCIAVLLLTYLWLDLQTLLLPYVASRRPCKPRGHQIVVTRESVNRRPPSPVDVCQRQGYAAVARGTSLSAAAAIRNVYKQERKCTIMWFYHIPKVAGTSLKVFLQHNAAARGGQSIDLTFDDQPMHKIFHEDRARFYRMRAERARELAAAVEQARADGVQLVVHQHNSFSGTLPWWPLLRKLSVAEAEHGGRLCLITMLREPGARFISEKKYWLYLHRQEDQLLDKMTRALGTPCLDGDSQVRYFLANVFRSQYHVTQGISAFHTRVALQILDTFDAVCFQDRIEHCERLLLQLAGWADDRIHNQHIQRVMPHKNESDERLPYPDIPRAYEHMVSEWHDADRAFYNAARRRRLGENG